MADRIIQMKDNQGNNLFPLVKLSPSILQESSYLPITGGILTGDLVLKGDPTSLLMPTTKQYVDNGFIKLTGGKVNVDTGNIFSANFANDTFGFAIGETDQAKTPLAATGRVFVYPYRPREEYNPGDCAFAAPDGTVDIMMRQEIQDWPDRIVGTVSEIPDYETWGTGSIEVNGRIWIKVR